MEQLDATFHNNHAENVIVAQRIFFFLSLSQTDYHIYSNCKPFFRNKKCLYSTILYQKLFFGSSLFFSECGGGAFFHSRGSNNRIKN